MGLLALASQACVKITPVNGTGGKNGAGSGGAGPGTASGGAGPGTASGGAGPGSGGAGANTGGAAGPGTGGASSGSGGEGTGSGGAPPPGSGGSGSDARGTVVDAGTDKVCQEAELNWAAKIPNVLVLVDRSGSMFDVSTALPMGAWPPLRDGVLAVVKDLQHDIRFGFGAFTGTQDMAGKCPVFETVPIALDNFTAIDTKYRGLGNTRPFNNSETPVMLVIPTVRTMLSQAGMGDKYILFVTDGEPDYCDNGNSLCSIDNVVGNLQALKAEGIHTFVFGVQSANASITPEVLQAFANAGAGAATAQPYGTRNIWNECAGYANWKAAQTASGKAMNEPIGTYATAGATTPVYKPNPADMTALAKQFAAVVAGVKSCTFDLGDIDGKTIKVDLMQLDKATITIMGATIPLSDTNGWRMNSATQLELTGTACATWRKPETTTIKFGFPCQIVIIE